MRAPNEESLYPSVLFHSPEEAAAFVAALSRFLNSPRGRTHAMGTDPLEVWSSSPGADGRVEIYLTESARKAVAEGFVAPPVAGTRRGDRLPKECIYVLGGNEIPVWGVEDAARAMERPTR